MFTRFLKLLPTGILFCCGALLGQTFTDVSELLMPRTVGTGLGASAVDFNNDGRVDIYTPARLYLNLPENEFEDILFPAGIFEGENVFGAAFGDYDDDGYLDVLFEDLGAPSRLYRNDRNRTFTQSNTATGVVVLALAQGAGWADFNLDGHLDLFVNNDDGNNQLFKNLGDGTFEDISLTADVQRLGNSYGMSWGDYNDDGYPDIFIATCSTDPEKSVKHLFRNNGDETFTNVNASAGVNDSLASWGIVWLDFDNDLDLDLYVSNTDHFPRRGFNRLYRNNGDGTFTNVADSAGVTGEAGENSYGVAAADFNNDGWLDIYVANTGERHRLYRNNGDGTFSDVAANAGVAESGFFAVAVADFNTDGWIDLFRTGSPQNRLLYNDGGENHWLSVQTRGVAANYYGVGARVEVVAGGLRQMREIRAGESFCSQNLNLSAHFGLGGASVVDSLIVRWPGGATDKMANLPADQSVTVVEGQGLNAPPSSFQLISPADSSELNTPSAPVEFSWQAATDAEDALAYRLMLTGPELDTVITVGNQTSFSLAPDFFAENQVCDWTVDVSDGASIRASTDVFHFADAACQEASFFEISQQYQIGESIVAGGVSTVDYDRDGLPDVLISSRVSSNTLYQNSGTGFAPVTDGDIDDDDRSSRGSTWGDYDNDGDLDVFIANANDENNLLYRNHNGTLQLVTAADAPVSDGGYSLGCTWLDYNQDHALDLFVTNFTGQNFLYRNNGNGSFERITGDALVSEARSSLGLAPADYDNDGDTDLYVCAQESGVLFSNNGDGTFSAVTDGDIGEALPQTWSASWGDLNHDGDLDLIVTRTGQPNALFENDGDGTFTRITEGSLVEGVSTSVSSSMGDLDNDGDLDVVIGTSGSTSLYLNHGDATFEAVTSDMTIQEEGHGSAWADFDRDGDQDLVLIGRNRQPVVFDNMGSENHWLSIRCVGTVSNRSAIGTRVRVKAMIAGQPTWQMREISGQTGYLSQNSLHAAFGLGDATMIDSLQIEWPSGAVDVITNVTADQFLTATEGEGVTDIERQPEVTPEQFTLHQNYPNPFNPETVIAYLLPQAAEVKIDIYNTRGQIVRTLVEARQDVGAHQVRWDGKNDVGKPAPSGVYYYRIRTGEFEQTRPMLLLR